MKRAVKYIRDHNSKIIKTWETKVRNEIKASNKSNPLALRNQLPHVLDNIAEILDRYNDFEEIKNNENFEEIIINSLEHGRHRASTSNYSVKEILEEYVAFHEVLTEVLRKNDAYTTEVGILLKYTLETAMINSASSFSESLNDMKEKLVGTLAHDIRNPLTSARLALDMLNPDDKKERVIQVKNVAIKSLNHSINLIEGLLDAITVKAGEGITLDFSESDLMKDIEWVLDEASLIFPNKFKLTTNSSIIIGIFDGAAMRRIIENLITNAVKYGEKDSEIEINVKDNEKDVSISVHNFGPPISENRMKNMFQFLNTADEDKSNGLKSWGMGLSLVKIVAEAHGGEVLVSSQKESGTIFKVRIEKFKNKPGKIKTQLNYN